MNFCPYCGTKKGGPEEIFCSNCGKRLLNEAAVPENEAPAGTQQAPTQPDGVFAATAQAPAQGPPDDTQVQNAGLVPPFSQASAKGGSSEDASDKASKPAPPSKQPPSAPVAPSTAPPQGGPAPTPTVQPPVQLPDSSAYPPATTNTEGAWPKTGQQYADGNFTGTATDGEAVLSAQFSGQDNTALPAAETPVQDEPLETREGVFDATLVTPDASAHETQPAASEAPFFAPQPEDTGTGISDPARAAGMPTEASVTDLQNTIDQMLGGETGEEPAGAEIAPVLLSGDFDEEPPSAASSGEPSTLSQGESTGEKESPPAVGAGGEPTGTRGGEGEEATHPDNAVQFVPREILWPTLTQEEAADDLDAIFFSDDIQNETAQEAMALGETLQDGMGEGGEMEEAIFSAAGLNQDFNIVQPEKPVAQAAPPVQQAGMPEMQEPAAQTGRPPEGVNLFAGEVPGEAPPAVDASVPPAQQPVQTIPAQQAAPQAGDLFAQQERSPYAAPETQDAAGGQAPVSQGEALHNTARYPVQQQKAAQPSQPSVDATRVMPAAGKQQADLESGGSDENLQAMYAEANRQAPPAIPLPEQTDKKARKPKRRKGRRVGLVLFAILIFVLGTAGATLSMLYYNNSSGKAISGFVDALASGDTQQVKASSVRAQSLSDASIEALFAEFTDSAANRSALKGQLERQAAGNPADDEPYPAIQMEGEPYLLFIDRWSIRLHTVDVLAEGAPAGTQLYLNDVAYNGSSTDGGMLYQNILPGTYGWMLMDASGATISSGEVSLFDHENPVPLSGGSGTVTPATAIVTVENCVSDEATITLNGETLPVKPQNGTVVLNSVPLGSTIHISAVVDGVERRGEARYTDEAVTTLRFEYEEVDEPDPDALSTAQSMSSADINTVLQAYYESYLSCVNNGSTSALQHSTGTNTADVAERIQLPGNTANSFEYIGAACDAASIQYTVVNDLPTINVNVTFQYRYTPRDGSADAAEASNRRTVQLVFEDSEWRVHRMETVSDERYDSHMLADL